MNTISTPPEMDEEYIWDFFGHNAEYYLQTWRLRQQGKLLTFNAAAFFGGLFWFAYRRMYLILALILVVLTLEGVLEERVFGFKRGTGSAVLANLITASIFGFFGNSLYLWHAERKMHKLLALGLPREELLVRLRRAGGTSWWLLLVLMGLMAVALLASKLLPQR